MALTQATLKLRKELLKFHTPAQSFHREDLAGGRWFVVFIERTLASHTSQTDMKALRAKYPKKSTEELAQKLMTTALHEAIGVTDAYDETISRSDIRAHTEPTPKGAKPVHFSNEVVALIAELLYTTQIQINLLFSLAALYEKDLKADVVIFTDVFGRALRGEKYDRKSLEGDPGLSLGGEIFDRAILQNLDETKGDAHRKGFYCFLTKAVGNDAHTFVETLPKYVAPKGPAPEGRGMLSTAPEEGGAADDAGTAFGDVL